MIGKKLNMGQAVTGTGQRVAVTRVKAGPVVVTALRDPEKDGYLAVQLGFGVAKHPTKAAIGHAQAAKVTPLLLREFRLERKEELNVGQEFSASDVFRKGEVVDITGVSKGKGFAGVIKRHGFHGGPKTHGQSDRHRAPGSIGSGTTPGRVLKGKKMAGRMGGEQVTVQGLEIIGLEGDELVLKGAIPGATGTVVLITKSQKKRKIYHGPQAQALPSGDEEDGEAKEDEGAEGTEGATEAPAEAAAETPAEEAQG